MNERYCDGSSYSCNVFHNEYECEKQDGCSWDGAGGGAAAQPCASSTASAAPSASGSASPSSSSSTANVPSACTGTSLACSKYHPDACSYQPTCESSYPVGCYERKNVGPPSCGSQSTKSACVATLGCSWQDPGGSKASAVFGTCAGQAAACDTLSEAECKSQPAYITSAQACSWSSMSTPDGAFLGRCLKESETSCSDFSATPPAADATYVKHPDYGRGRCELRKGCAWQPLP